MFKPSKIEILRASIEKVTQILADRDLKVTQRGTEAYVLRDADGTPTEVNIPYVPDSASDQLLAAIQGFVDHEVSHVLFSDPECAKQAKMKGERTEKLYGFFNDAFAESSMRSHFRGSSRNLNELAEFYTESKLKDRWEELEASGASEKEKCGAMIGAITRAWSGDVFYEDFMADKWGSMASLIDKVPQSFIDEVANASSSSDSLRLTEEFIKIISEEEPPEGENGDDEDSDSASGGDSGGGSKSKGDSKDSPKDNSSEPESPDSEGENEDQDENDSEGENEDDSGDDDESEDKDDEHEKEEESKPTPPPPPEASEALDEFFKGEQETGDMEGAINDAVASGLESDNNEYLVWTTDFDQILIAPECQDKHYADGIKQLEEKALTNIGAASKRLEKAFVSQNRVFYESNKRSGGINPSALFRLKTGDTRVFRKKVEISSLNTAVTLLIDQSGSMMGSKVGNAAIASYMLAEILTRIKIPFEIIGFTTEWYSVFGYTSEESAANEKLYVKHGRGYSRREPLRTFIYKDFNEPFQVSQRKRLTKLYLASEGVEGAHLHQNADAESVMLAATRLATRSEPRKCMIVLSDGRPEVKGINHHQNRQLKENVKNIEAAGIDIVGLGVQSYAVRDYYSRHITFYDSEEIAGQVLDQLSRILIAKSPI